jgi:hypothetical protein
VNQAIEVRTDYTHGTTHLLAGLPAKGIWDCNVHHALLTLGYLTSPPRYQGLSFSNYWAWLRYGASIDSSAPKLRLRDIWSDIDPHQKTILADDFGMGFTCRYLIDQHGFEDFGDTKFLLQHMLKGHASLKKSPQKKGAAKSPDFIAVDGLGRLHILECKGTQSSRHYLKKAIGKGREQKGNVSSTSGIFKTSMVGGIYVPLYESREEAEIVFTDPDPGDEIIALGKLGRPAIADGVRRVSLAKMLSAVGLWQAATVVFEGTTNSIDSRLVRDIKNFGLRFSGFELNSAQKRYERVIEHRSLERKGDSNSPLEGFLTKLVVSAPQSITELFSKDAFGKGGLLPQEAIDQWIKKELNTRRRKYNVRFHEKIRENRAPDIKMQPLYKEAIRTIKGSWSESSTHTSPNDKGEMTEVMTGVGVSLAIQRKQFE